MKYPLLLFFVLNSLAAHPGMHPVHVSVTNMEFEQGLIKVTINTFVDDWEVAYFHYFGKQVSLKDPVYLEGEWFADYLQKSFRLSLDHGDTFLALETDTITFNDLSMTISMHVEQKEKVKTLYIYNSILTDIFADQNNLFIFSLENRQMGIKFDIKKVHDELKLR